MLSLVSVRTRHRATEAWIQSILGFFARGPQVDTRPMNITSPRYQWYTEAWIGIQYKGGERLDGHPVAILPPWLQVKNQVEIHPWVPFVNFTSFKECHF